MKNPPLQSHSPAREGYRTISRSGTMATSVLGRRDLTISLMHVGNVQRRMGKHEGAEEQKLLERVTELQSRLPKEP